MKFFVIVATLMLAACASDPKGGAVVGGAVGGAAGAAVGYEMGGRDGAVIGGAIGAAAGAAIGSDASQPVQQSVPVGKSRGHDEEKHRAHRKKGRDREDHDEDD